MSRVLHHHDDDHVPSVKDRADKVRRWYARDSSGTPREDSGNITCNIHWALSSFMFIIIGRATCQAPKY